MKHIFSTLLKDFQDNEEGSITVEFVLVFPILVWALLSTWVYFDAFHEKAKGQRAMDVVADMFSRESTVNDTFINSAFELYKTLTPGMEDHKFRVTVTEYDQATNAYVLVWSRGRGLPDLTNSDLQFIDTKIPVVQDQGDIILVETSSEYNAIGAAGIGPFTTSNLSSLDFTYFMPIATRKASRLCFEVNSSTLVCDP